MHALILKICLGVVCLVFLYFFATTKLTIIVHRLFPGKRTDTSHIYWIYTNKWLIRLTDQKPLIAAILLFQYNKLVERIVSQLRRSGVKHKKVIQISCAFGDVTQKVVAECSEQGAGEIVISDIIENELRHVERKLNGTGQCCKFVREDALNLTHADDSFDVAIMFFLLHELPQAQKYGALKEAARVLKPGGKLIIGEFHEPTPALLKASGWMYFKTFEPYALPIWSHASPSRILGEATGADWQIEKETCFFENFQVMTAVKA